MGGNQRFVWLAVAVLLAAGFFAWRREASAPREQADVAPLREALRRSAETALPDPSLTGAKLELRSADPAKAAAELVALASDLGGSAFALAENDEQKVTANIPRAKASQFAAGTGQDYRLTGEAEDMITFEVAIRPNLGAPAR